MMLQEKALSRHMAPRDNKNQTKVTTEIKNIHKL